MVAMKVFVTNVVTIQHDVIKGSEQYAYYHEKCWHKVLARIQRKPHKLKDNLSVAEIETSNPEVLNQQCTYCNHRIGE